MHIFIVLRDKSVVFTIKRSTYMSKWLHIYKVVMLVFWCFWILRIKIHSEVVIKVARSYREQVTWVGKVCFPATSKDHCLHWVKQCTLCGNTHRMTRPRAAHLQDVQKTGTSDGNGRRLSAMTATGSSRLQDGACALRRGACRSGPLRCHHTGRAAGHHASKTMSAGDKHTCINTGLITRSINTVSIKLCL